VKKEAAMKKYVGMFLFATVTGMTPAVMAAPYAAMLAPSNIGTPVNLLASSAALCDVDTADAQSAKICEVRLAAERRAQEITRTEGMVSRGNYREPAMPMTLLIPVQYAPGTEFKCAPSVSQEECERLKNRIPGAPDAPLSPPPPAAPVIPPTPVVPEAVKPPVATDPESIVRPPRTGDDDLVRRPPPSGSQMPVIVPQPAPPVIP